ncbi:MAG: DNA topoisomerase VI subunit B [Candidatus Diapherotrites archaeon CG08_land_8_20_14_0_20_34_12]|nr:MAG: DNA topoisomerase VI subunit B [Candidatus Diapherotrites archaeon CG08_land_8_20_14_0_20_34_12]
MLAGKTEKPKKEKLEKTQKAEEVEETQGTEETEEETQEAEQNNGKIISAETLSKEFKEHSVAEFFKKNRQMLGLYGKIRTLTTIVHEYVTNSLDACEEANILPEIEVKIEELGEEYYVVSTQDNGPGLTKETVGKALGQLLAGTKFHRMVQMRGQQGIGACMKSDTLVPLADGRILPIKEIVDKNMVGIEAISLDLNSLKLVPGKITRCWKPKNPLFVKVKTAKGRAIHLTPENPVLTIKDSEPIWIRADEIKEGMKIAAPNKLFAFTNQLRAIDLFKHEDIQVDEQDILKMLKAKLIQKYGSLTEIAKHLGVKKDRIRNWFTRKMPNNNPRGRPTLQQVITMIKLLGLQEDEILQKITRIGRNGTYVKMPAYIGQDILWLSGFMAGDGHLTSKKDDKWGVNISFTNKDINLINKCKNILEEKFGLKTQQYFHKEKHYCTLQCSSKILSEIFESLGVTRGNKSKCFDLSNTLLQLSDGHIAAYLKGLFDAEGSITQEKRMITLTLYNKKALEKIFYALLRIGIHANINKSREENRITITATENIYKFYQKIGFSSSKKTQKLIELLENKKVNTQTDTIPGINPSVINYLRTEEIALTKLPAAAYSAIHSGNISRYALVQVLNTAGIIGTTGEYLNALANADVSWLTVKEICFEKNEEEFVYDLEIEKYHNFVAGGIICHNSGCTMLSQMTTGKPTKVITGTGNGKTYSLEISIDTKENRPKISNLKEMLKQFRGVAIQTKFKGVLYKESDQGVLEYLRRTAIANPHAQIRFRNPKGILTTFHRSVNKIPKRPMEMKPHPLGVTIDDILSWSKTIDARKTNSFLKKAFDRVGDTSIDKIQQNLRFDLNKDPKQLSWEEAEQIIHAFKQVNFSAPSTEGLCPIGEEHIKKSLENIVKPEIVYTFTRKPTVYSGGFPFQVEVAIAYGGNAGRVVNETTPKEGEVQERRVEIMRYSNRAPLMFDAGTCAITKAVQSIDWKRYAMGDINNAPISLFVNFISAHVPYTGAGKTSIADEEEVMEELRLALMQVGRRTARYIIKKEKEKIKQEKKRVFMKYAIEVARAVGELTKKDPAKIEKKLLDIVIKRLKLEEEQEKKEEAALEEEDDEKLEKELEKLVKKKDAEEKKIKGGKKKSKKAAKESDDE